MGGSLRRSKKTRQKMSIKARRKPKVRSRVPTELKRATAEEWQKLGLEHWDDQKTYHSNYSHAGLIPDANATFGRNTRPDQLQVTRRDGESCRLLLLRSAAGLSIVIPSHTHVLLHKVYREWQMNAFLAFCKGPDRCQDRTGLIRTTTYCCAG